MDWIPSEEKRAFENDSRGKALQSRKEMTLLMKGDMKKLNNEWTINRIWQRLYMREAVLDLLQSRIPKEEERI